jgi:hypothetical protein
MWIPFDSSGKNVLVDPEPYPRQAAITLTAKSRKAARASSSPPEDSGAVLEPSNTDNLVYAPFWLLSTPDPDQGWVAVNASDGSVAAGELPATPRAAKARLSLCLGMAIFAAFLGGAILYTLLTTLVVDVLKLPDAAVAAIGLGGILYITWRLLYLFPPILEEPALRAQSGLLRLPLSPAWLRLFRVSGFVVLTLLLLEVLSLVQSFLMHDIHDQIPVFLFGAAKIVLAGLFVLFAFTHGRAGAISRRSARKARPLSGRYIELVRSCVNVTAFSLAGMLTGAVLFQTDLWRLLSGFEANHHVLMIHGAEIGAFLAILFTRIPIGARIPIAAGMAAETLGRQFASPWLQAALVLGVVLLAEILTVLLGRVRGNKSQTFFNSCRAAWGFSIGAALGRLLGRMLGTFLLGPGGTVVGQVLGARIGGTAGYMSQRQETPEDAGG